MAYFKTTEPDYFDVVLIPHTCIPEVTCSTQELSYQLNEFRNVIYPVLQHKYIMSQLTCNPPRQHAAAAKSELPANQSFTTQKIAVASYEQQECCKLRGASCTWQYLQTNLPYPQLINIPTALKLLLLKFRKPRKVTQESVTFIDIGEEEGCENESQHPGTEQTRQTRHRSCETGSWQ